MRTRYIHFRIRTLATIAYVIRSAAVFFCRILDDDRLLFIACVIGPGLVSLLIGQDINWDLRNYHWYNAHAFINDRFGWDLAPAQLQTYHNPLADLPFYYLVSIIDQPRLIAFIMGSIYGVGLFFLMKTIMLFIPTNATFPVWYRVAAALIGVTGAASLPLVGSTMNDCQIAALVLVGLYLALRATDRDLDMRAWALLLMSGLLLGLATGLKLTAGIYALALCFALLVTEWSPRKVFLQASAFSVAVLLGFALTMGHWMRTLYDAYGSPLFPYFNQVFLSPYWEPHAYIDDRFGPKSVLQWIAMPYYIAIRNQGLVGEVPMQDPRLALVMTLGLAALAITVKRVRSGQASHVRLLLGDSTTVSRSWRILLTFSLISYLFWLGLYGIYRYIVPIELLTGLLIVFFCIILTKTVRARNRAVLWATILIIIFTKYPSWGRMHFGDHYFEITAPQLDKNALVLLVGMDALSYLIPFLDEDVRFAGPYNNLNNVSHTNLLQRQIHDVIAEHQGPIYSIDQPTHADSRKLETLQHLNLVPIEPLCQPIISNMEDDPIILCPLRRAGAADHAADDRP